LALRFTRNSSIKFIFIPDPPKKVGGE
jgi:hypothetical protein